MIHLRSIRASPPGAMRPEVTSPNRLPRGGTAGAGGHDVGSRDESGGDCAPGANRPGPPRRSLDLDCEPISLRHPIHHRIEQDGFPNPSQTGEQKRTGGAEPASGPNDKGIEGVDIIITTDEGLRRLSRARGIRIQCGLHVTDYNGVGRFPPAPPVLGVPGRAPPVMNPGGPVSGRRPRGRAAMRADPPGTTGARPAGDSPCADAGLTVTLRHLLG